MTPLKILAFAFYLTPLPFFPLNHHFSLYIERTFYPHPLTSSTCLDLKTLGLLERRNILEYIWFHFDFAEKGVLRRKNLDVHPLPLHRHFPYPPAEFNANKFNSSGI